MLKRSAWATAVAVAATLTGSFGVTTAAGAATPSPGERTTVTGTVKTLIRETHRGGEAHRDKAHLKRTPREKAPERIRVVHTGKRVVPVAEGQEGSLARAEDGSTVSVQTEQTADGAKVLSSTTLEGASSGTSTVSATRQVYVAVVRPKNLTSLPVFSEDVIRTAVRNASDYWMSQTGGKVGFGVVKVLPVYTSAYACGTTSSATNMWNEALKKMPEAQGVGRHLLVVAPEGSADVSNGPCDYGIATYGSLDDNQNLAFVAATNQSVVAHELGHNLGRDHSNALRCSTAQDGSYASGTFTGCTPEPYFDILDVMGLSGEAFGEGNLNAVHLAGMGLLPSAVEPVAVGSGSTTHRIEPLSASPTALRGLKIQDPTGPTYYVNYRTNTGRDTVATRNFLKPTLGVEVLREAPDADPGASSYVLDYSPSTTTYDFDRVVPVGGVFRAASGRLAIRVDQTDSLGATVTVNGGGAFPTAERWAGTNRYASSATFSANTYAAGVPVAYVANGLTFPDALSGAPIAGKDGGPVLLTAADSIPSPIATELARLKPQRIVVLGGTGAVSDTVKSALAKYATSGTVDRWAGRDRYASSAEFSARSYAAGVPVAYVANGLTFPDALSGAPIAGRTRGPVLLTSATSLPSVIAAELDRLNPQRIVVLGGTGAVSSSVQQQLSAYLG